MAQQKKQLHYLYIWTGLLSLMCTGGKDENNKWEMLKVARMSVYVCVWGGGTRSHWDLGEPLHNGSVSANRLNDFPH